MSSKKSNISNPPLPAPQDVGVRRSSGDVRSDRTRLRIDGLAAGGRGVARSEGLVWFVAGGLPGDEVLAEPLRRRPRFIEARAVAVMEPSPNRREPSCRLQQRCGGCPWMPLDEELQREWKIRLIRDALDRIGGLSELRPERVRTPSPPLGYRNRMEFALCWGGGEAPAVGFHAARPDRGVLDVESCPLQHEEANRVLDSVRSFVARQSSGDAWRSKVRQQSRLLIRRSDLSGEILVAVRDAARPLPRARAMASFLVRRHEKVVGVVRLIAPRGGRGGTSTQTLAGQDRIEERVAGLRLMLPAASFLQVSTPGARELVHLVDEMAGNVSSARIVELYGGVGVFSMSLLRRGAASATVCEADLGAIVAGTETAAESGLEGLEFVHEDVRSFVDRRGARDEVDLIVANPPRTGLGKRVAESIRSWRPARVILVSCDPPTLARDLGVLVGAGAYRVERIVPVDLFPQTAHIETAVLLTSV